MWSITHIPTPKPTELSCTSYKLLVGETYIVGRKDCSVVLASDQSISRKHATIYVDDELGRPGAPPVGILKDTSKYGTAVNDTKVDGTGRPLREGDIIRFGMLGVNDWRVSYTPLVAVMSSVEGDDKERVNRTVRRLGGHVVNDWRKDCTHLVMTEIRITIKVVCCLASECPIVTPAFLETMVVAIQNQQPFPNPAHFRPPLAEVTLNESEVSFAPDPRRRTLFAGTKFVCFSHKQFKKIHLAIHLAGGETVWVGDGGVTSSMLIAPVTCVVQIPADLDCQGMIPDVPNVTTFLRKNGNRMIPESEIGLSLLYCSMNKYCNPRFDIGAAVLHMPPVISQTLSQPNILVSDSEQTQPRRTPYYSQSLVAGETPSSEHSQQSRSVIQSASNGIAIKRSAGYDDYGNTGGSSPQRKQFKNESLSVNSDHAGYKAGVQNSGILGRSQEDDLFTWDNKPTLESRKRPADVYNDDYRDTAEPTSKVPRSSEDYRHSTEPSSTKISSGKLSRLNPESGLIEEYSPDPASGPNSPIDSKAGIHYLPGGWIVAKLNNSTISDHTNPTDGVTDNEDDLPSRLIVTVAADDLIVATPTPQPPTPYTRGVNFKKFRKVGVRTAGGIPLIIGGSDLTIRIRNEDGFMVNLEETDSPVNDGANVNGDDKMFEWAASPPRARIITVSRR